LKDIIKECILEVMLEGLRPGSETSLSESSSRKSRSQVPQLLPVGKKHLDSVSFSSGVAKVANKAQGRGHIPAVVSTLAAEFPTEQRGIMQQIFEDTARNTLPNQMQAERSPGAAMAVRADAQSPVANLDPMSLFDGASNWADIAFSTSKK